MRRGEIFEVDLNPTRGSEQQGRRPCVIVQRNVPQEYDERNPMTIIVPLTDANGKPPTLLCPFVAQGIAGTTKDSRILCQQVRAIAKIRLGRKIGDLPQSIMILVDKGLRAVLDLLTN
jgi:mRNA interferase MazF